MKGHLSALNVLDYYRGKSAFVTGSVLLSVAAVREEGKVLIADNRLYKSVDGSPAGTVLIFQNFEHSENRIKLISKSLLVVFYMKNLLKKF